MVFESGVKLEKEISDEICSFLAKQDIFFWREEMGKTNDGRRRKYALRKNTFRGMPDILCLIDGTLVCFEIKSPYNRKGLRPEQKLVREKIMANGGKYFLVRTVEEVKRTVQPYFLTLF